MSSDTVSQAQLRLLQFLSPALPVGAYCYSQGLEWAVENGWVNDEENFQCWIEDLIASNLSEQELPLLIRLYQAVANKDTDAFDYWCRFSCALRETSEMRLEEYSRARAYLRVLDEIDTVAELWSRESLSLTPLASMAVFACKNNITQRDLLVAFAHNWLEATLVTGVKIVPLGQSRGQKLLFAMSSELLTAIERSECIDDDSVGISLPALTMASCAHEVQYSRVYRS